MKNIIILIMLLFANGCSNGKSDKENKPLVVQTEKQEPKILVEDKDSIPNKSPDSTRFILEEINDCLKVDYEFEKEEVVGYEEIYKGEKKLYLVKLEPSVSIEALGNDPLVNLVILYDEQYHYINIPSVYAEDFNLLEKQQDVVIFEYYSSPVGYTQLIVINLNSFELFASDKILEHEELIQESLNLSINEFRVTDEQGNELRKNFKPGKWTSCVE